MIEIKTASIDELMARRAEIAQEINGENADLDALETEVREINNELETRRSAEAQREEIRSQVAAGDGAIVETIHTEEKPMDLKEIRKSDAYINAYANYIKTGDDAECRALLTENATNGTVPVPELVYSIVQTAWDKNDILSRVKKTYMKGNLKVSFMISGDDAVVHTEGAGAVSAENLVMGIVNLVPESIKKIVEISDESMDMSGAEFLQFVYDEIAYKIAKKEADRAIAAIEACGTASTTTCPGVPEMVASTVALGTVAAALGQLSDEADNPVVIMNKATWADFKAAQYAANYPVDPFEGLPVLFNNTIASFGAATTGVSYMLVGDLSAIIANFPGGEEIEIKTDYTTKMDSDLVRILGRQYSAIGVVAPDHFVKVVKEASA